jgi:hypothetical protein
MRKLAVLTLALALVTGTQAQEFAKPGPEHEVLNKRVGNWDTVMKAGGAEFKGTMKYKMDLGGLWLAGALETDLGGMKFSGRSMDTYDAKTKKYVGVWFDNMGTTPMSMEGSYDKDKKTMTMIGKGPGMDGKITTWRSVSRMSDDDTVVMNMYVGDAKEPMFTVTYKRKK